MSENTVRSAIGAALDHPFAEEAFALVDVIEANVRDGEPGGELHEVAAEITDRIIEVMSARSIATLWAVLNANSEGTAELGFPSSEAGGTTLDAVKIDLFVVVERAVFAGLETFAEEAGR